MSDVRIIKRYQNRKLYDTKGCAYITLQELGVLYKECKDLKVYDNKTKNDITAAALLQVLFDRERRKGTLDLEVISRIVKSEEGIFSDYISNRL